MISRILALVIKEFAAIWQDPRARASLLAPPIMQFCLFVFAATLDVSHIQVAIYNRDNGVHSRDFIQRIQGSGLFTSIAFIQHQEELAPLLDAQRVLMAISIDDQFSKNYERGLPGSIQITVDGRRTNTGQIALGYVASIAAGFGGREAHIKIVPRYWYNPNLYYPWFTVTGIIGLLSMVTCLGVSGMSLAREREMGTLDQLLISPMSSLEILIGKALPATVVGILEGVLMLALGIVFLGLPLQGSFVLLVISLTAFITAIVGVGLFISSLCSTQQQAMIGVFLVMAPTVLLSGFATPVENIAPWMKWLSILDPLKYFNTISRGLCLKGMSVTDVVSNVVPMLLIAVGTLSAAVLQFRRRLV